MAELSRLEDDLKIYDRLASRLEEASILHSLAQEEGDEATGAEAATVLAGVESSLEEAEVRTLLAGEHDEANAIVSSHAGAGGTGSCEWAEMLLRMYLRWAERRGLTTELVELQEGEGAGIKRATFILEGRFAYGLASTEKGVHRLVRISPYDAAKRRHTSFASVDVVPEIDDSEVPEIDVKELRIDTYRSQGAGGQHVNVTDSAVRITHLPTGVQVAVQNERSQLQNRAVAMKILAARLAQRAQEERLKELQELRGEQMEIGFGSQIRSYVLAPYQLVKDHRTDVEKGEFVFLVGTTGSGKTTLIKMMMREEEPSEGRIYVAGKDLSMLPRWRIPYLRRMIGCVFQDYKLLPNKTVYENVAFALE